jgi:hypothetical protein
MVNANAQPKANGEACNRQGCEGGGNCVGGCVGGCVGVAGSKFACQGSKFEQSRQAFKLELKVELNGEECAALADAAEMGRRHERSTLQPLQPLQVEAEGGGQSRAGEGQVARVSVSKSVWAGALALRAMVLHLVVVGIAGGVLSVRVLASVVQAVLEMRVDLGHCRGESSKRRKETCAGEEGGGCDAAEGGGQVSAGQVVQLRHISAVARQVYWRLAKLAQSPLMLPGACEHLLLGPAYHQVSIY